MWTSKIFWKLFLVYAGLSIAVTVSLLWLFAGWQRELVIDRSTASLAESGKLILAAVERDESSDLLTSLAARLPGDRQTSLQLINDQGKLIAGRGSQEVDYSVSEDVAKVLGGDVDLARAIEGQTLHVALPVRAKDQLVGVLRLSQSLVAIDNQIASIDQAMILIVGGVMVVAVALTYAIIGRIVRPLTELTEDAQAIAEDEESQFSGNAQDELYVLGNAFDQMQRKLDRGMGQLRENSERLATVLGSMVEGVIAVSSEEIILLANEASRSLLDMTVSNPVGRPLLEVTRNLAVHAAFIEALDSPSPVQREFESFGPTRRVLSLRATRLPGEPSSGVMIVLHDISEVRRLENLRREFVANVSHELKTPLASIKAYAETLKMGALNDPEHSVHFVNRIEEQAERLHQLILDLIQLARVESGQAAFEIVDLDLAEAVYDCLEQYANAAEAKQIKLTVVPPDKPLTVRGDEEGVRTILSNLIDNAVKYTPERGEVTVRWQADGRLATIEVQDTGIGIAEKDQARIFERFYRVDKARSREMGGTGLGLSIVKHLAQSFGGTVGVESRVGQGSMFRVRLLLVRNAATASTAATSS